MTIDYITAVENQEKEIEKRKELRHKRDKISHTKYNNLKRKKTKKGE